MEEKKKIELEGLDDEEVTADTTSILTQVRINEIDDDEIEEENENIEDQTSEEENEEDARPENTIIDAEVEEISEEKQEEVSETNQKLNHLKDDLEDKLEDTAKAIGDKMQTGLDQAGKGLSLRFRYLGMGILDYFEDMIGLFIEHNYQSEMIYSNSAGHQFGYYLLSHLLMMIPVVSVCLGVKNRHPIYFKNISVGMESLKVAGLVCAILFVAKLLFGMLLKIYENIMNHHNYGYMRIMKMINIQEMVLLPFLLLGSLFYGLAAYFTPLIYVGVGLMVLGVIVSYAVMNKMMVRFKVMFEEKLSYDILLPVFVCIYYCGCGSVVYMLFTSFLKLVIKGLLK